MKTRFILIASLIMLAACQTAPNDPAAVEDVIRDYFTAISNNDQMAADAVCTADYMLLEHGMYWNNDSLFMMAGPMFDQGATIAYRFENFETTIDGNTAWTYYDNYGLMTVGGQEIPLHWLESAVMEYDDGHWKMALLHSTRIEQNAAAATE